MPRTEVKKIEQNVANMWKLHSDFGVEKEPENVFMAIISNRYALVKGTQMLRDELQLAFNSPSYRHSEHWANLGDGIMECGADLTTPSVLTTCGYTMCGDRICQSLALKRYQTMVAGRFGSMTESGETKPELFFATGGGTDSGPTLAHVTVGHALDARIKDNLYSGNADNFFLCNIDVCTHCGHLDIGSENKADFLGNTYAKVGTIYGLAQESELRDPRPCCGAIVGMITNFNMHNPVHVRLRSDLGEANWNYLAKNDIKADDGSPVKFLIAAAIIAIQGMRNTVDALGPGGELDERGLGHMTAQVQVNNVEGKETLLYCARSTVYGGVIMEQGLGTDATKYQAVMDGHNVRFLYDGKKDFPIVTRTYAMAGAKVAPAPVQQVANEMSAMSVDGSKGKKNKNKQAGQDDSAKPVVAAAVPAVAEAGEAAN
eukprot:CAMPEP_0196721258 /NCGR_PEP_ID=MMETSP1091-20130531/3883_1 /TAXON_ID=302021 /ORGANISM="Rhodomonas sp., Strain CCMP768" /LENGTH=429 /DNA_ID=CAMNT_0042062699 /DNA_START=23 /DNA_END=1312 /DNA_ORIENTATION=-